MANDDLSLKPITASYAAELWTKLVEFFTTSGRAPDLLRTSILHFHRLFERRIQLEAIPLRDLTFIYALLTGVELKEFPMRRKSALLAELRSRYDETLHSTKQEETSNIDTFKPPETQEPEESSLADTFVNLRKKVEPTGGMQSMFLNTYEPDSSLQYESGVPFQLLVLEAYERTTPPVSVEIPEIHRD